MYLNLTDIHSVDRIFTNVYFHCRIWILATGLIKEKMVSYSSQLE